jgi:hypothetical protein
MATYNFSKDAKTDDGHEMQRFLRDGHTTKELTAGTYRLATTDVVAPGSLGVLPANVTYRLHPDGGIQLVVT